MEDMISMIIYEVKKSSSKFTQNTIFLCSTTVIYKT